MKITITFLSLFCGLFLSSSLLANEQEKLETAANEGDADAMFEVGSIALLDHDYPKAFKWLSRGTAKKRR